MYPFVSLNFILEALKNHEITQTTISGSLSSRLRAYLLATSPVIGEKWCTHQARPSITKLLLPLQPSPHFTCVYLYLQLVAGIVFSLRKHGTSEGRALVAPSRIRRFTSTISSVHDYVFDDKWCKRQTQSRPKCEGGAEPSSSRLPR